MDATMESMSDAQLLDASALDVFIALHNFAWYYRGGESTADMAAYLNSPAGASDWRDSVVYVTRFHPTLENTDAEQLSSDGPIGPGRILTLNEGFKVAAELLAFHNTINATEVWWFVEYLNSDPAAWSDWLTSMRGVLSHDR